MNAKDVFHAIKFEAYLKNTKRAPWWRNDLKHGITTRPHHECRFTLEGRKMKADFWTGVDDDQPVRKETVLRALIEDAFAGQETFEHFCQEYGYDPEHSESLRIYHACRRQDEKLQAFLAEHYGEIGELHTLCED